MSKQQMPVTKCFISFNTERTEELCGLIPKAIGNTGEARRRKVYLYVTVKNKRPAWKIRAGRRVRREISGGRENWTLRHRVSFRLHCCRDCRCRRPRRCCAGFRHHLGFHRRRHRYSCGSVRSRNAMELDSCGSARNTFAAPMAPNKNAWVADCKSVAAKSRGCRCRPGCHVASAVAARKNDRCWNSLGGCCCCCWAPRAARPGR